MSEMMTEAILEAPFELAMSDELSRMQFWSRVQLLMKQRRQMIDALDLIADWPITDHKNMDAMNMRGIAKAARGDYDKT